MQEVMEWLGRYRVLSDIGERERTRFVGTSMEREGNLAGAKVLEQNIHKTNTLQYKLHTVWACISILLLGQTDGHIRLCVRHKTSERRTR